MDIWVLRTQEWLNETYTGRTGYSPIVEDGLTGSGTVRALIIALQIELGIASPVPSFGPETKRRFPNLSIQEPDEDPNNLNKILQGAFWCKGYHPGGFTGIFYSATERAVKEFQRDVGILNDDGVVDAQLMSAILNTDGFRLKSPEGQPHVRTIQQILNREYSRYFDYIPTNGVYERKTNTAIIYALQHEIGIGDIANGNYGDATIANTPVLSPSHAPVRQTRVLQFALAVNGYYMMDDFRGIYDSTVERGVRDFQSFMTLPVTGIASMPTIKQLLTSNGYTGRSAIACDASMIIDNDKAQTLVNHGYQIIGRYLTGTVSSADGPRSKAMTAQELSILSAHGIRVFPIFQDGWHDTDYFRFRGKGTSDALKAIRAANELGFPSGTAIYFAVDYDAYDFEVTDYILPYLAEVKSVLNRNSKYKLGVYGARNTCIRAMNHSSIRAEYSFVSNMSTGFSGNLGYPMPANWAFGQFFEMFIGSGNGRFDIDKNDYSGRDTGVTSVSPPPIDHQDSRYEARYAEMMRIAQKLPGFLLDPNIVTTNFNFNRTYEVLNTPLFKVDIQANTSYAIPQNEEGSMAIEVSNGSIGVSVKERLSEMFDGYSYARVSFFENTINDLSASIGNGWIQLTSKMDGTKHVMSITAFKDNIPVEGGGDVSLSMSVIITVETSVAGPPVYEPVLSEHFQVIVLGALFILGLVYAGATLGFASLTALVLFLIGETDDID